MATDSSFFAFVLMPFDSAFNDIYQLGIKEAAKSLDIVAERVDDQRFKQGMLEQIYRQIEAADVIIADMTGQNPNVFYEVGYAHAKDKLCIHLTQKADDIPFDLKHQRHLVYGKSIADLRTKLTAELEWAKGEIQRLRDSPIQVSLKIDDVTLDRQPHIDWGEADFVIDLHNRSPHPSPEINAVYVYLAKGWTVTQDGRRCGSTDSDIPGRKGERHLLATPVRRLNQNDWAQLKFSARKVLATSFQGEELKDEYPLKGKVNVRLSTSHGVFDQDFSVDAKFEEFPF